MSEPPSNTSPAELLLFSDQPLSREAEDLLHRGPFTRAAARVLDGLLAHEPSTVAAVVGPWGSGKSSTVNFTIGKMGGYERVVRLDPWMVGGPTAVAQEVVTAVTQALGRADLPPEAMSAVRRYFKTAMAAAAGAGWALGGAMAAQHGVDLGPEAAAVIADATKAVTTSAQDATRVREVHEATLEGAFTAISRLLRERQQGVLVVVDDVDRLQPDELLALFKAVRLLGRLPFVHYLLVYDEQTVIDLLTGSSPALKAPGRALAYLEKVVPMRLEQPEVTTDHLVELLDAGWHDLVHDLAVPLSTATERAWAMEVEALLVRCLVTPRAVRRFFTQLRLTLDLVGPDDVDVVDLAVLTVLRLHHPGLYRALARERDLLTELVVVDEDDRHRRQVEALLQRPPGVGPRDWRPVVDAVHRLFPNATDPSADVWLERRQPGRRGPRAQDGDVVGRYFALSPLGGDLSGAQLMEAVRDASRGEVTDATERLWRALSAPTGDRASVSGLQRLLRKLDDVVSGAAPTVQGAAALVSAVCAAAPLPHWPGLDPRARAVSLLSTLLGQVIADPALARELVVQADAAPARTSQLWLLVSAWNGVLQRSMGRGRDELTAALRESAWAVVVASADGGDGAPVDDAGDLGAWVAAWLDEAFLTERVGDALANGTDPLALLARLLPLGRSRDADGGAAAVVMTMTPDEAEALVDVVGLGAVLDLYSPAELERQAERYRAAQAADRLGDAVAAPTWADRRAAAAATVLHVMAGDGRRPPHGELERSSRPALTDAESSAATELRSCDVRLVMTVVVPEVDRPLDLTGRAFGEFGGEGWIDGWERTVQSALEASPAAAWVEDAPEEVEELLGPQVGADRGSWISYARGYHLGADRTDPSDERSTSPDGTTSARALFARAALGTVPDAPDSVAITFTLALGLRLRRLPDPGRTSASWTPHARELWELPDLAAALLALLRTAPVAEASLRAVPAAAEDDSAAGRPDRAAVHLLVETAGDLTGAVRISLTGRYESGQRSTFRWPGTTAALSGLGAAGADGASARHVARVLQDWLGDAGWRSGVGDLVASAVESAASEEAG